MKFKDYPIVRLLFGKNTSKVSVLLRLVQIAVAAYGMKKIADFVIRWLHSVSILKKAQAQQKAKLEIGVKQIKDLLIHYQSHLPSREMTQKIVHADVTELIRMLDERETTSLQLVLCFLSRAATIGLQYNAVTDFNHNEAVLMAIECDKYRFDLPHLPPLYGIPISVKSNFQLRNFDSSMGLIERFGRRDHEDGLFIQILKEQFGAIPFVKSNTPTGIFGTESINYVHGEVYNTYDKTRTPGGSSSGEAALISSCCSPLGVGTDAAGSIRTPCLLSGLYGFILSPQRVTTRGVSHVGAGTAEYVKVYIGPMAKSVRDLVLFTKSLVSNEFMWENDFYLMPQPWNDQTLLKPQTTTVAIFPESPLFDLTDGQKRVMLQTINELTRLGVKVVPFVYENAYKLVESFLIMSASISEAFTHEFRYDFVGGEAQALRTWHNVPRAVKQVGLWLAQKLQKSERLIEISKGLYPKNMHAFYSDFEQAQVWIDQVHRKFDEEKIDALLIPGLSVAYKLGTAHVLSATHRALIFPNAARLCAGVVPVDKMKVGEDKFDDRFNDFITSSIRENLKDGEGLPLGVQVCGPRNGDEKCLQVMAMIEGIFKYRHTNSGLEPLT